MVRLSAEIKVGEQWYEIVDNLISISFSGQDRSDPSLPSWGIKSNSGSLEMYDTDGTFEKLSREGNLQNCEIRIFLGVDDRIAPLGTFYVSGASKDRQTSKIKIEFEDVLTSWQDIQVPKYYNFDANTEITIADIIDVVSTKGGVYNVHDNTDDVTKERIENIYIKYREIQEGTVWSQMTKICEASSCYIYCDKWGLPTIYYGGDT